MDFTWALCGPDLDRHYIAVWAYILFLKHAIKGPLKCFETRSVILCADVILTETGRQGGTYKAALLLLKINNRVCLYIAMLYCILCKIQIGLIHFVVCADSCMWSTPCYRVSGPEQNVCAVHWLVWHSTKPDFFVLNGKHIYTAWIIPCPLYSALRVIHRTECTNSVNNWPISARLQRLFIV